MPNARADVFNMPAGQTSLQFVTVGAPGNVADTVVESDGTTGYGSVAYVYQIGKFDVTNAQYAQFLNAKDPLGTNTLHLWAQNMGAHSEINLIPSNPVGSKYWHGSLMFGTS